MIYLYILYIIACNIILYYVYVNFINPPSNLPYEIYGDELYQKDKLNNGEYSRFNYKTKESVHWVSRTICNEVLQSKKLNCTILVLGVALGDMIIHLSNKRPDFKITGIDISDINFDIVKKYSNKNVILIKEDANKFIIDNNNKFDYIICDLFDSLKIPSFVFSVNFLTKINKMILPNGKFLVNTLGLEDDVLINLYYELFTNSEIELRSNNSNIVSIITKKYYC